MARVISIHEYDLKPGADVTAFEQAVRDAERRGLFALAGLVEHHFLKGIKGTRRDSGSALYYSNLSYTRSAERQIVDPNY